jgi:hypothetical protein
MFGQDWDKAEATITARDGKFFGDGSTVTYTYVADVRLASGETFRTTINEPTIATNFWPPSIGDVVSVLVKAKDRKVKFDKDDERLSVKAYEAAKKKAFEDAQRQPSGTPATVRPPSADIPDAVAKKLAELGIAGGSSMQVISGDSAQAQAVLAALAQAGVAGAPAEQTPEARLGKLKGLYDRGLLTAEEYAEQRQRILSEI